MHRDEAGAGALASSSAPRHLERQLPPLPHRPGRGLPAAPRHRRPGPPGDQGTRGAAAADGPPVAGYDVAAAGHNQWNGVALISRVGLDDVEVGFPGQPSWGEPLAAEARAIGATCGGVRVWSLYVPNGRKPDDPHYAYKLDWLARLREAAAAWRDSPTALVGDWNICPTDDDVFDPAQFRTSTHVTPPERAAFQAFLDDGYAEVDPRPRPRLHLLGLLPAALRARPRPQDRLRARLRPSGRAGHRRLHRPRRARRDRAPPTTRR